jgi:preprotein translocase subunit SecD
VIRSEITGGKAQITGSFTEQEGTELAAKINDAVGVGR